MSENESRAIRAIESERGNTNNPARPDRCQGSQSIKWCFTYNNYDDRAIERLEQLLDCECKMYIFQTEVGASGTPHLQGVINLNVRRRLSQLKTWDNKIHWEPCKNWLASVAYCQKEEGRAVDYCRKSKGVKVKVDLKLWEPDMKWQQDLISLLKAEPNDRIIYWYYSLNGAKRKSSFVKWCVAKMGAVLINKGAYKDMINQVYNVKDDPEIILVDIPRNMRKISYGALESIKDGLICNSKYETGTRMFNSPHIVVFCNFAYERDNEIFSEDRIVEVCLDN